VLVKQAKVRENIVDYSKPAPARSRARDVSTTRSRKYNDLAAMRRTPQDEADISREQEMLGGPGR
jgi:hypothetical protein